MWLSIVIRFNAGCPASSADAAPPSKQLSQNWTDAFRE